MISGLVHGRPNPMSAKLHHVSTNLAVHDSFALGLEQIIIKKFKSPNLWVRNWQRPEQQFKKNNILKKFYILSLAIQRKAQSYSSNTEKTRNLCKICPLLTIPEVLLNRDFSDVTLVSEDSVCFEGRPCVLEFGSFSVVLLKPLFGLPWSGLVWSGQVRSGMVTWASSKSRVTLVSTQRCNWQTTKDKWQRKYSAYPVFICLICSN